MARARSVLTYLVEQQGIDPHRIGATGYGEYRPIAQNDTSAGRRKNRRVEIVVLPQSASRAPEFVPPGHDTVNLSESHEPAYTK